MGWKLLPVLSIRISCTERWLSLCVVFFPDTSHQPDAGVVVYVYVTTTLLSGERSELQAIS